MKIDQVALQLYTVRERAAEDFFATLEQVAKMGYRAVELAGTHGASAAETRARLDQVGLRAMAAHISLDRFVEDVDGVVAEATTLGCDYAIIPWLAPERRADSAAVREVAGQLDRCGERCQAAGLRLAYHNHDFEFAPLADDTNTNALELLIEATHPRLVAFELDVFWVRYAGHDPVALIQRLGERVPIVHLKDMADGAERADAPVGAGIIDWDPMLNAAETAGAAWYVVEQDHPRDALVDVETSLRNLEQMAAT